MLRHDERRLRLVFADGRRLRTPAAALRPAADGPGRVGCCALRAASRAQAATQERARVMRRRVEQKSTLTSEICMKSVAASRKPNSVPPAALAAAAAVTTIPLAPPSLAGSSDLPGGLGRAVRCRRVAADWPPYLVLLRAGFCLPPVLPPARCALTAPFHPYSPSPPTGLRARQALRACRAEARQREGGRYIFCATVLQVALTGRYPAHCPAEFGLSSRLRAASVGAAIVWLTATRTASCAGGRSSGSRAV